MGDYISALKTSLYRQLEILLRNWEEGVFQSDFMYFSSNSFLDIARFKEYIVEKRDWENCYKEFITSEQTKEEMENLFLCPISDSGYILINNYIHKFGLEKLLNEHCNSKNENVFKIIL